MKSKQPALDKRDRRGVWLALIGLVVLLGGLYIAGHFLLGNRLPTGTRIGGVGVGGLTPDEAAERLEVDLGPRTQKPLTFYFEDREFTLKPGDVGLDLRIDESVSEAGGGRTWNPVRMLEIAVGAERVDPVISINDKQLNQWIDGVADDVDIAPVEPKVEFRDSTMVVRKPEAGRAVLRKSLAQAIREEYVQKRDPIALPVATDRPAVTRAEFSKAMRNRVRVATRAPLKVKVGSNFSLRLSPNEIKSMLSYRVSDGQLATRINQSRFKKLVTAKSKKFRKSPQPAKVVMRGGRPRVVSDKPGRGVTYAGSAKKVIGALERRQAAKRVTALQPRTLPASFRTKNAKKLGIKKRVASYTQRYPKGQYQQRRQARAARRISGTVIRPGKVFGFDQAAGGSRGDVSPVATAVFNAAYGNGFAILDRKAHRVYRSHLPVGRDATTSGKAQLRFRNNTDFGVLVRVRTSAGRVTVDFWSTRHRSAKVQVGNRKNVAKPKVRRRSGRRCTPRSGTPGFDIEVRRTVQRNGKQVASNTLRTSYASKPRIRCRR